MTQRGAMGGPPVQPGGMSPSGARSPSSRPADFPIMEGGAGSALDEIRAIIAETQANIDATHRNLEKIRRNLYIILACYVVTALCFLIVIVVGLGR